MKKIQKDGTFIVKANVTQEMIDDLKLMKGFDYDAHDKIIKDMAEEMEKKKKYKHRRRVAEKILKVDKTNNEK